VSGALAPRLPLADVGAYAQRVEALGYDGLHIAETVHDAFVVATLAIAATARITIRTSVLLAFVRSPTLTAYSAWDLSALSGGRFELGLGAQIRQNIEQRFAMPYGDPVARLRDYVGALNALFAAFASGSGIDFSSEHYSLTRLQPYFNPGPDTATRVPSIWLGGVNKEMCQLAGECAAGFVSHPTNSTPQYLDAVCWPNLDIGLARSGRSRRDIEVVAGAQVITGATTAELAAERERQRRLFAFLYSTPAYRPTLQLLARESLGDDLRRMIRDDRWDDLAALVPDELLDAVSPAARYDELAALVLERYRRRADGVLLAPPVDNHHDSEFVHVIATLQSA